MLWKLLPGAILDQNWDLPTIDKGMTFFFLLPGQAALLMPGPSEPGEWMHHGDTSQGWQVSCPKKTKKAFCMLQEDKHRDKNTKSPWGCERCSEPLQLTCRAISDRENTAEPSYKANISQRESYQCFQRFLLVHLLQWPNAPQSLTHRLGITIAQCWTKPSTGDTQLKQHYQGVSEATAHLLANTETCNTPLVHCGIGPQKATPWNKQHPSILSLLSSAHPVCSAVSLCKANSGLPGRLNHRVQHTAASALSP